MVLVTPGIFDGISLEVSSGSIAWAILTDTTAQMTSALIMIM